MKSVMFLSLALFGATAAQAVPAGSFRQAGYDVEMQRKGDTLVLTGRNAKNNSTFNLNVDRDNRVTGVWNGQPVAFVVDAKKVRGTDVAGQ